MIELYTLVSSDLGLAFIGNLMTIEEEAVGPIDAGVFYPMVTQHLAAGGYGLGARESAEWAPWFTRLLIRAYLRR